MPSTVLRQPRLRAVTFAPSLPTRSVFSVLTALTAACALTLAGCGRPDADASSVKIRQGALVPNEASGPERISTAGLVAITPDGSFTCSAGILDNDLLVTAAHCLGDDVRLYAYFGLDMRDTGSGGTFIDIDASLVHPEYDAKQKRRGLPPHDIAVLRLRDPIPEGYVPAPLLSSSVALTPGEQVLIAGFGITERGGDSQVLRYATSTYAGTDDDGRLGLNDPTRRGACSGDSGGPLFVQRSGVWYLGGVLSGGPIPCIGINLYTGLPAHADFVRSARASL